MRRYRLPMLSGVLMALVFWPFYFWPLALAALAPFFYFAAQPERSQREVFFGGCIAGALAVALTLYISLFQLAMQPGAPVLTYAVRASSLFFLVFIGALFGALAVLYRRLRTGRPLADSLLAASLYTLVELLLFAVFSGYYYASLAHALVPFPPALLIASLGGAPLLVFAAAWINAIAAQRSWRLALGAAAVLAAACTGAWWYGQAYATVGQDLRVSIIQRLPQSLLYVSAPAPAPFGDYGLQQLIVEAADDGKTALAVYPFSPVEAVYEGTRPAVETLDNLQPDAAIGGWLKGFVPASTTVVLWNTLVSQGNLYDQFEFWKEGTVQAYQKHMLHPLSDYTPQWMRGFGLARVPYTLSPGNAGPVSAAGARIGGLVCSELQLGGYVRAQALQSGLLLSIGFDEFFPGGFAARWSLGAARKRAAENGVPLIRAHIAGPSALIAADGAIAASLPYGAAGVLRGDLPMKKIPTLYAYAGSLPLYVCIAALLLYLSVSRVNSDPDARRRG